MKQHINLLMIVFLITGIFSNCTAQTRTISQNNSMQIKAKKLKELYTKATNTSLDEMYKRQFFDAFPNTFNELNELYGYNSDTIGPLEDVFYEHIFGLFNKIKYINDTIYYRKIISIAIGGHWDADAISAFQEGLRNRVSIKPKLVTYLLGKMQDKQIKSFWYFYFDGPHPDKAIPDELSVVKETDTHIYGLMEDALKEVQQSWKDE